MSSALVPSPAGRDSAQAVVTAEDFMPFKVADVVARKETIDKIIAELLIPGVDFGELPGTGSKTRVLKKPGAEKLCSAFGLAPKIVKETKIKDWTGSEHGGEPFFEYEYQLALCRGDRFFGEATASCNSWEDKYRYRWVSEDQAKDRPDFTKLTRRGGRKTVFEMDFAIDKKETTGKYGKPLEYWHHIEDAIRTGKAKRTTKQFKKGGRTFDGFEVELDDVQVRIPNPSAADVVNTIQKMAYKRALVAAVMVVTNCSDGFTQDIDEEEESTQPRDVEEPRDSTAPAPEAPPPTKREMRGDVGHEKPRVIPEEMRQLISDVRRDPKTHLRVAWDLLWQRAAKRGEACGYAHDALNKEFRSKYPKGSAEGNEVEALINHMLDLYELIETFPPQPEP